MRFMLAGLALGWTTGGLAQPNIVCYNRTVPQLAFAAREFGPRFRLNPATATSTCAVCVSVQVIASTHPAQSYAIAHTGRRFVITAPDANGAMYGMLDLAEAARIGTLDDVKDGEHAPHIARRGIKFNIPLDARTPSYSDMGDAAQANIAEVWTMEFWRAFIDGMARDRYNVLSLWSLHPFPSMVQVPEYPDVALNDVTRTKAALDDSFSSRGTDFARPAMLAQLDTIRRMTIAEKVRFWRDVMQYAKDRGVDVYVFTWNIYTYGATGKYGITDAQDNPATVAYFRASVRELLRQYPLLAGIGITAGEQMDDRRTGADATERWLYATYGLGIQDALKDEPARKFNLIHRYHEAKQADVLDAWKDFPGGMDFSFKYSVAHMYSIPDPPFIKPVLDVMPPGMRTWLTIRNDDVYTFRWGNPDYARDYLRAIPGPERIAGFYMGPDGYTWGREFLARTPTNPRELVMQKEWYSFMLWGRLAFDPALSDQHFERILAQHFGLADASRLAAAWSSASMVFPLITRFFWGDIDLKWFPEASLSHPRHHGYYDVRDFMTGATMPGSGVMSILEWRRAILQKGPMAGITPMEIAEDLQQAGDNAVTQRRRLSALHSVRPREFSNTLGDIDSMAELAYYYAYKIRGASWLALYDRTGDHDHQLRAVAELEEATKHWVRYAASYSRQYTSPHLFTRVGFVDIPRLTARVLADVDLARSWKPGTVPGDTPPPPRESTPFRP